YGESSRGPSPRSAHLIMLREHPDELLPRTERGDRAQRGRAVLLLDEEMMLRTPDLHHEVLAGLLVERRPRAAGLDDLPRVVGGGPEDVADQGVEARPGRDARGGVGVREPDQLLLRDPDRSLLRGGCGARQET